MSIKTSRAQGVAKITIDYNRCISCGACVKVCCGMPLYMEDGKVQFDQSRLFGCIGCGQCMAVCPVGCISVEGRCISTGDIVEVTNMDHCINYELLHQSMLLRRSIRRYQDREIDQELIEKILAAAATAPMGIPPSDVAVVVFKGRDKVRQFAFDFVDYLQGKRWMFSPVMRWLLRPFIGKPAVETFETFIAPTADFFVETKKRGENWVLYDAPLAMFFQASPYCDPADSYVAATYAMLAAEALGLGTCMIGSIAPIIKYSSELKVKYRLLPDLQGGLIVLFGYPAVKYKRGIKRSFASVTYY